MTCLRMGHFLFNNILVLYQYISYSSKKPNFCGVFRRFSFTIATRKEWLKDNGGFYVRF